MSNPIQQRATAASEIRSTDGDGRSLELLAVKWGQRDAIGSPEDGYGYYETFDRRSFDKTIALKGAAGVRLLGHHDIRSNPVGVITKLWTDDEGLKAHARLSDTAAGRDIATLVADGALQDVSIGFRLVKNGDEWSRDNKSVLRKEVALAEISIVNIGALKDAKITAARSDGYRTISPEQAALRLRLLELN